MSVSRSHPLTSLANHPTREVFNSVCRIMTQLAQEHLVTRPSVVELAPTIGETINQYIVRLVEANPPVMIKPVDPPSEEVLDDFTRILAEGGPLDNLDTLTKLINVMARSVKYHTVAKDLFFAKDMTIEEDRDLYSSILEVSCGLSAYALLQNPVECSDVIVENQAVLLNYNTELDKVQELLDQYVPYWKSLPEDVALTGPFIYHLLQGDYEDGLAGRHYTPTYYDLRGQDLDEEFYITPTGFHFPVQGSSEHATLRMISYSFSDEDYPTTVTAPCATIEILNVSDEYDATASVVNVPIVPGTNIGVAVFDPDKLEEVARYIYHTVKKPGVSMRKYTTSHGKTYRISMAKAVPKSVDKTRYISSYLNFMTIEVYHTTPNQIYTSHLEPERGYLMPDEDTPMFYLEPSMLRCLYRDGKLANYYHYGKDQPLKLLAEYLFRGCDLPDYLMNKEVERAISEYDGILPCGYVPDQNLD